MSGIAGKVEGVQVSDCEFNEGIEKWVIEGKVCILF